LAGTVGTTLQRSPNTNFIISTADVFNTYIQQGLKAVGKQVPLIGAVGNNLPRALAAGGGETADVLDPPAALLGWYSADAIMRAVADQATSYALPARLVDASNCPQSCPLNSQFPDLAGYQATFKQAWGIQKLSGRPWRSSTRRSTTPGRCGP
jgi:hypothetical protein